MKRWQFWLGVLISAFFLYRVLQNVDFNLLITDILQANYLWIIPGVAVYFVAVWARAWRWHYLLRPLKAISTRTMFPIVTIGYAGNNIYPARAGEVIRAVVLRRKEGVPVSASLATIIVERIFDGVVMLGFVFLNLPELARLTDQFTVIGSLTIQDVALWGSIAFLGALLVFLAAAMFPQFTERVIQALVRRFLPERMHTSVMDLVCRFLVGLESLRSPREVLMVFLTSVVIWLLETVKYWFVMYAFDFQVSFFTLMLMNGVVNLATTIPSAPGYIGTFDLPGIAVLQAYGVPQEVATSYTFVLHFALWLPITVLGLYYMAQEGVHWNKDVDEFKHTVRSTP
jgi:glycosyltransferase 2 family protein